MHARIDPILRLSANADRALKLGMPSTAWSSSGSLISERLTPRQPRQSQIKGTTKSSGRATPEPLKSSAVRALEARLNGARDSTLHHTKDPKGGCFCQARSHGLSPDVPLCKQCGLILCMLNPAHRACPHCTVPLLNIRTREALVEKLEGELATLLAKEEAARQRVIEEARAAEGAFPTLSGARSSTPTQAQTQAITSAHSTPASSTTHTVLSLNSNTRKVKVSSYSAPTAATSLSASRENAHREEEGRVLRPPEEVCFVKEPLDSRRPWRNIRAGDVKYVTPSGEGKSEKKTE